LLIGILFSFEAIVRVFVISFLCINEFSVAWDAKRVIRKKMSSEMPSLAKPRCYVLYCLASCSPRKCVDLGKRTLMSWLASDSLCY
jgi:hypothetical protein